jgi:DNA-binding NtrC family response regulator
MKYAILMRIVFDVCQHVQGRAVTIVNILFLAINTCIHNELQEYVRDRQGEAYFANNIEEAISLLHTHPIDVAVLNLIRVADIRLLKYINKEFKHVRIVLAVEQNLENAISTIRNSQFGFLHKPFTLQELDEIVGQKRSEKDCHTSLSEHKTL